MALTKSIYIFREKKKSLFKGPFMILNEKHIYNFYNQEADLTHVFKYGIK